MEYFSSHWKQCYLSNLKLTVSLLVPGWFFLSILTLVNPVWLSVVLLFFVFSSKCLSWCVFSADKQVCTDRLMYDRLQTFFHDNFEYPMSKWLYLKASFWSLVCLWKTPYFRCRSHELKKWYHLQEEKNGL